MSSKLETIRAASDAAVSCGTDAEAVLEALEKAASESGIAFRGFNKNQASEDLQTIRALVENELSEPYSRYVYQYFSSTWPRLSFFVTDSESKEVLGTIVASLRPHKDRMRGYIAMLAVKPDARGRGLAKLLIARIVVEMRRLNADEVTLETEITNSAALGLYGSLGFVRTRRMHRYYLTTNDAFRLILPLTKFSPQSTVIFDKQRANAIGYQMAPHTEQQIQPIYDALESLNQLGQTIQ